jgi:hypothetical protein
LPDERKIAREKSKQTRCDHHQGKHQMTHTKMHISNAPVPIVERTIVVDSQHAVKMLVALSIHTTMPEMCKSQSSTQDRRQKKRSPINTNT